MRTKLFHRELDQGSSLATLERQQALVLAALRDGSGRPVSYASLRDAGVEFPASVVCELELAGVAIERSGEYVRARPPSGADAAGASRLGEAPYVPPAASEPRNALLPGEAAAGGWIARAAFVVAALLTAALVIAAVALGGGGRQPSSADTRAGRAPASTPTPRAHRRAPYSRASTAAAGGASTVPQGRERVPPPGTPVSATLAARLEARGHGLLQSGDYGEAIAVLRTALATTGQSLGVCLRPASEACFTYAYALYDLGRALLLGGRAAEAASVLEHRLQIENQRPIVAAELASARGEVG